MSLAEVIGRLDAEARRKLDKKLPSWAGVGVTVPASINLEQSSSEATALYKASLIDAGARVADLTGGLGADSWAFSRRASSVWYNERDAVLMETVRHNFALLGISNAVFNAFDINPQDDAWLDSLRAFRPDVIYLDPARRNASGHKVFLFEECSPDVTALLPQLLELASKVIIKVSPMADLTMLRRRLSGAISELHVVGTAGECKELLCICTRSAGDCRTVLSEDGHVMEPGEWSDAPEGPMLFVPSAALTKFGLGPGMRLMDFDDTLAHFGRFWQVIENLPFASSVLKTLGQRYPQAEVTARGVPISSDELRKKLKVKPGGDIHIFACTLSGERRLLVCR